MPLDWPIAKGGLHRGGADIFDSFQEGFGGVLVDMGVMTSVFDKALFDVDTKGVNNGFVGCSQSESSFCQGAQNISFFNFV